MKSETSFFFDKADLALQAATRDLAAGDTGNAMARAYYAAFYAASAALHEAGVTVRSHAGVHHQLFRAYVQSGRLDREMTSTLSRLQQNREEATYEVGVPSPKQKPGMPSGRQRGL